MKCRCCGQTVDETQFETLAEYEAFTGYCQDCENTLEMGVEYDNDLILEQQELEDFEGLESEWDCDDDYPY